jgi:hypothetical protein
MAFSIALKWAFDELCTINRSWDIVFEIARGSDSTELWYFKIRYLENKST